MDVHCVVTLDVDYRLYGIILRIQFDGRDGAQKRKMIYHDESGWS